MFQKIWDRVIVTSVASPLLTTPTALHKFSVCFVTPVPKVLKPVTDLKFKASIYFFKNLVSQFQDVFVFFIFYSPSQCFWQWVLYKMLRSNVFALCYKQRIQNDKCVFRAK